MSDQQELAVVRRTDGTLLPGQRSIGGRKSGSIGKVNRMVKERMAQAISEGVEHHPAQILLSIANDPEVPVSIRVRAAADLLPYLMPVKFNIEVENSEIDMSVEFERIKTTLSSITGG